MRETELASYDGDKTGGTAVTEHLRLCAPCRNALADYRWLQREIASTLRAAVDSVPVPQPNWLEVQGRVRAGERRLSLRRSISGIASLALVICLMFVASPLLGAASGGRTLPPEAIPVPSPVSLVASGGTSSSAATPTPARSHREAAPAQMLPLVSLPTPRATDAAQG